ncbi:MAG TPA: hypothetical protein PKK04_02085, partial [Candidatus Woesebacteria bacterium]|nr:hypothetical protein [Candidatus Woesebacteria bacterium]
MKQLSNFLENTRGQERAEWNKTIIGEERVKNSNFYEERGSIRKEKFFKGRPIIGRDRKINGGVYLGADEREAIVVDDQKDLVLNKIYQELINRRLRAQKKGIPFKEGIIEETWNLVNEVMPFDQERVEAITSELPEPDTKIYLSAFLDGGVCRHQALLTGYLLERLAREGIIRGQASVDRNYVEDLGGHAWARYTNHDGDVFILDSALNYIGRLDEINEYRWFYERPE